VLSAEDALCKDHVDGEEHNNSSVDEDVAGDGEADVSKMRSPCHAQGECDYARVAETKDHGVHGEEVAILLVCDEAAHVQSTSNEVEGHEDCGDGNVWQVRGSSTQSLKV